jgi:hypothetical protein
MARRTTRRRRDDTWVVKEDEFHPDPRVAARQADRLAMNAALRNNAEDVARVESRLANGGLDGNERRAQELELARLQGERSRTEAEIREWEEASDGS